MGLNHATGMDQNDHMQTELNPTTGQDVSHSGVFRGGNGLSVLNTMRRLVAIDEIMCHKERELDHDLDPVPGTNGLNIRC